MTTALEKYKQSIESEQELSPIERLRFFCSLAMSGRDWLDSEQFFKDLEAATQVDGEPVAWMARRIDWPAENYEPFKTNPKWASESYPLFAFPPDAAAKIAKLEKDRAELVEALEIAKNALKSITYGSSAEKLILVAREALTKMKGE